MRGKEGEQGAAVGGELGRSDSGDLGQLVERCGTRFGDRLERPVVEHDVGRNTAA